MASVTQTKFRPYPWRGHDGVTVTGLSEIPSRVAVRRIEVVAGASFVTEGGEEHRHFVVLAGSGWAQWAGQDRTVFTEGNTIFVLDGDRVTIGAADEVTLLEIRADLMMPGR